MIFLSFLLTIIDLISALLQLPYGNTPSVFVFLYNVKNGATCTVGTDGNATTIKTLSPLINCAAAMSGYCVDRELKLFSTAALNIPLPDFGITILMVFFAKYYSRGQYPLFVHTFRCIAELEIVERTLLSHNQKSLNLPPNLATHELFGLKNQSGKFTDSKHLTVQTYRHIHAYMCSPDVTVEKFIGVIRSLHINIVESFYMFTSITKNCKVINECHDLLHSNMKFTFQKPTKSLRYDGDFWFELPAKAVWFAYFQGQVKFSAYIGCDIKNSLKIFHSNDVLCLVVGFTVNSLIYPIIFEDPQLYGEWPKIIDYMHRRSFNCALIGGQPGSQHHNVHFVKNKISMVFKLEK